MIAIRHIYRWESGDGPCEFELGKLTGRLITGNGQVLDQSRDDWIALYKAISNAISTGKAASEAEPALENSGKPWTDDLDKDLLAMHGTGASVNNLAHHFKRTPGAICSRLQRLGVAPLP